MRLRTWFRTTHILVAVTGALMAPACSSNTTLQDANVTDAPRDGVFDARANDSNTQDVTAQDVTAQDVQGSDTQGTDAVVDSPPDVPMTLCGDGIMQAGELCDDGNRNDDDLCRNDCTIQCGDGIVNTAAGESCDTAITTGTGVCPTSCDDGMACTADLSLGTACTAACAHMPITATVAGDLCCPAGATSLTDSDCPVVCGNSAVETGETCDTAIATGSGACPTAASCNDAVACTTDAVAGTACAATCTHTPITATTAGDGCCPTGATHATDTDCPLGCGDGVVTPPETCDTAIATGTGSCPTAASCNDSMACTTDALVSSGTCSAACTHTPITAPANGDSCCPTGANATNDNDCAPRCGNTVVETGETCDDGNTTAGDGCSATCQTEAGVMPTAFRMTTLSLISPRVVINVFGCRDITQTAFLGTSVNGEIATSITGFTLNIVSVFRPLSTAAPTSPLDITTNAACMAGTPASCGLAAMMPAVTSTTAVNMATGNCFTAVAADVNTRAGAPATYSPGVNVVSGPCFASSQTTLNVNLSGIIVPLQRARIAAQYSGTPTSRLITGVVTGFLSEADARGVILPATLAVIGGDPLYSHLQAGGATGSGCNLGGGTAEDDRDTIMNPDGTTTRGFWFFLNFTADRATWTSP